MVGKISAMDNNDKMCFRRVSKEKKRSEKKRIKCRAHRERNVE
jgi:hypothetical protein